MRIAIFGATGVLGRALIPRLIENKHDVLALSPRPEKAQALYGNSIEIAQADLLSPNLVAEATNLLKGADSVLQLATAIPPASEVAKADAWDANTRIRTEGTARLLEAVLAAGVKQYIQQSITMAYPDMGDEWISEETPLDASRKVLITMENYLRAIPAETLNWTILRGAVFVGKDTFQDETIRALKAHEPLLACDGQAYQSYIRVEDMAEAVLLAAEQNLAGKTFNICAEPLREIDYLQALAKAIEVGEVISKPDAPCPISQRCSNQAAKSLLGWEAKHSLIL